MFKSVYHIKEMDCPSEEQLIRMKLQDVGHIEALKFDLQSRILTVYHSEEDPAISAALESLSLGATLRDSRPTNEDIPSGDDDQRRLLWTVLWINFTFFMIEMATGIWSDSMGLVADSLDMLADSFVYGISLMAVGGTVRRKKNIATIAGYFQMLLAAMGLIELIRRFTGMDDIPDYRMMIIVSALALVANGICLYLLQRSRREEAHMRASMIFTSNDVVINSGVILAGVFTLWLQSNLPDLIIGLIVFMVVFRGAISILKLGK